MFIAWIRDASVSTDSARAYIVIAARYITIATAYITISTRYIMVAARYIVFATAYITIVTRCKENASRDIVNGLRSPNRIFHDSEIGTIATVVIVTA